MTERQLYFLISQMWLMTSFLVEGFGSWLCIGLALFILIYGGKNETNNR